MASTGTFLASLPITVATLPPLLVLVGDSSDYSHSFLTHSHILWFLFRCHYSTIIKYRGLGTHISFVRSVRMDSWTPQQLKLMKQGGNKRCNDFLQSHGILQLTGDRETIQQKYDSPAAELYKEVLKAEIEGRPVPTELPKNFKPKRTQQSTAPRRKMEGFGSSPPPEPESMITGKRILYVAVPAVAVAAIWLLVPH